MLKFEFDDEKQNIFLKFWRIKEISEFYAIANKPELFFLRLCLLNDVALKYLGKILLANLFSREANIEDYPPHPLKEADTKDRELNDGQMEGSSREILDMLDSIHAINLWQRSPKNNSNKILDHKILGDTSNLAQYQLTPELENCFKTFARQPHFPEIEDLDEKSLSREEQNLLSRFLEFYAFTNNQILLHHSEETLLKLKKKGYIDFFFISQSWTPAAVVNRGVFLKKKLSQSHPPLPNPFPREQLAESIFFLQILEYEHEFMTSISKYYPSSQEKMNFLGKIFQELSQLSQKDRFVYSSLSFSERIIFLTREFAPVEYQFLKTLLREQDEQIEPILNDLAVGMELKEVTYEVNRRSFIIDPTGQIHFPEEQVKEILNHLALMGLLVKNQNNYYGDPDILHELGELLRTPRDGDVPHSRGEKVPSQKIIIDSDYTIVATKEQIRSEEIFFLHHFCTLKISPHLIRGHLDTEKSSFAWYFQIDKHQLLDFFKNRSQFDSNGQSSFKEMLELYFEHTPYFKIGTALYISTPSKNFFLTLKYFLEDHGFISQVIILEEEKAFIFHQPDVFKKVKEAFPESIPIKFFKKQ